MPQPQSLADFSTAAPAHLGGDAAPPRTAPRSVRRFAEVRARIAGNLPYVSVGSVYEDMDPRCEGRIVQVLAVARDARVLVRVLTAATVEPRTPAAQRRDTVNDSHWIAQIRFREGSRGFRYLYQGDKDAVRVYLAGCEFAALLGRDLTRGDLRVVGALAALLPGQRLEDYFSQWRRLGNLATYYDKNGPSGLLSNATVFDTAGRDQVVTTKTKAARTHSRANLA